MCRAARCASGRRRRSAADRHVCSICGDLRVYFTDDEVFRVPASVTVCTVDKLAAVGFEPHVSHLISGPARKCPTHGYFTHFRREFDKSQFLRNDRCLAGSYCSVTEEGLPNDPAGGGQGSGAGDPGAGRDASAAGRARRLRRALRDAVRAPAARSGPRRERQPGREADEAARGDCDDRALRGAGAQPVRAPREGVPGARLDARAQPSTRRSRTTPRASTSARSRCCATPPSSADASRRFCTPRSSGSRTNPAQALELLELESISDEQELLDELFLYELSLGYVNRSRDGDVIQTELNDYEKRLWPRPAPRAAARLRRGDAAPRSLTRFG